jgi:hypothetical protein
MFAPILVVFVLLVVLVSIAWTIGYLLNRLDDNRYHLEKMHRGLKAVENLINDSYGVSGLHMNGNVAPWDDLRTGGRYEAWLVDFDVALGHAESNNTIVIDFKPKN